MGQERDCLVHFVRLANALLNNETNNSNAWPFTLQFAIWVQLGSRAVNKPYKQFHLCLAQYRRP